jgi:hypothetical protein
MPHPRELTGEQGRGHAKAAARESCPSARASLWAFLLALRLFGIDERNEPPDRGPHIEGRSDDAG